MFTPADLAKLVKPPTKQNATLPQGPINELGAALDRALKVAESLATTAAQRRQLAEIRLARTQKGDLPGVQHAALGRLFDLAVELGVNYGDLFGGDVVNHRK